MGEQHLEKVAVTPAIIVMLRNLIPVWSVNGQISLRARESSGVRTPLQFTGVVNPGSVGSMSCA